MNADDHGANGSSKDRSPYRKWLMRTLGIRKNDTGYRGVSRSSYTPSRLRNEVTTEESLEASHRRGASTETTSDANSDTHTADARTILSSKTSLSAEPSLTEESIKNNQIRWLQLDPKSEDLWAIAFKQLSRKEQAALQTVVDYEKPSALPERDLMQELERYAQEKRLEWETSQYVITFKDREIRPREILTKIITCIHKFQRVMDVVSNVDPVHIGLPWAAVRVLLQVATSTNQLKVNMLVGVELVIRLLARCRMYEGMFLRSALLVQTEPRRRLKDAIVALYSKALQILCRAIQLNWQGIFRKSLHALSTTDILIDVEDCERLENGVQKEAITCEWIINRAAAEDIKLDCRRILNTMQEITLLDRYEQVDTKLRGKILTRLSPVAHEEDHYFARRDRVENSGQWLLRHDTFSQWYDNGESDILWLHGIVGGGKTVLASSVVDALKQQRDESGNNAAIACFYCDRNRLDHRKPRKILASLVRQLSTMRGPDKLHWRIIQRHVQQQKNGFASGDIKLEESRELLISLATAHPRVYFIIDALDECDSKSRGKLIDSLKLLVQESQSTVKIFVTSRADWDIRRRLEQFRSMEMTTSHSSADLNRFIDQKLTEHMAISGSSLPWALYSNIKETIITKSQGMFQWAKLQIDQLFELPPREADIRTHLGQLPKGLTQTYDEIWSRIREQPGSSPVVAKRALHWVICSQIPLPPKILAAFVCQEPEKTEFLPVDIDIDFVLQACHNLLVVDHEQQICRLSHVSIQEYFEEHSDLLTNKHAPLARISLNLLLSTDMKDIMNDSSGASGQTGLAKTQFRYCRPGLDSKKDHTVCLDSQLPFPRSEELQIRDNSFWQEGNVAVEVTRGSQRKKYLITDDPRLALLAYAFMFWRNHFDAITDPASRSEVSKLKDQFLKSLKGAWKLRKRHIVIHNPSGDVHVFSLFKPIQFNRMGEHFRKFRYHHISGRTLQVEWRTGTPYGSACRDRSPFRSTYASSLPASMREYVDSDP